jgi:hypothetical protein
VHSRQYYGADLAFGLTLTITSHFHLLPFFPPCRVWLKMTAARSRGSIGQRWCDGSGGSWDLSFAKPTRWITQPVGWWGSTGEHAGEDA